MTPKMPSWASALLLLLAALHSTGGVAGLPAAPVVAAPAPAGITTTTVGNLTTTILGPVPDLSAAVANKKGCASIPVTVLTPRAKMMVRKPFTFRITVPGKLGDSGVYFFFMRDETDQSIEIMGASDVKGRVQHTFPLPPHLNAAHSFRVMVRFYYPGAPTTGEGEHDCNYLSAPFKIKANPAPGPARCVGRVRVANMTMSNPAAIKGIKRVAFNVTLAVPARPSDDNVDPYTVDKQAPDLFSHPDLKTAMTSPNVSFVEGLQVKHKYSLFFITNEDGDPSDPRTGWLQCYGSSATFTVPK